MRAITIFKAILTSILVMSILIGLPSLSDKEVEINSHLAHFSKYNNTHHDNIYDEPHSHTHKHDEDSEEHEHNHDHSKVTQSGLKFISNNIEIKIQAIIVKSKLAFFDKKLISNPHPSQIYRPPIHF